MVGSVHCVAWTCVQWNSLHGTICKNCLVTRYGNSKQVCSRIFQQVLNLKVCLHVPYMYTPLQRGRVLQEHVQGRLPRHRLQLWWRHLDVRREPAHFLQPWHLRLSVRPPDLPHYRRELRLPCVSGESSDNHTCKHPPATYMCRYKYLYIFQFGLFFR